MQLTKIGKNNKELIFFLISLKIFLIKKEYKEVYNTRIDKLAYSFKILEFRYLKKFKQRKEP